MPASPGSTRPTVHPAPPDKIVTALRSLARLAPWDRTQDDAPATPGAERLDAEGWVSWCVAGLAVFARPGEHTEAPAEIPAPRPPWVFSCEDAEAPAPPPHGPWVPPIRAASREARRVVAVLAMLRHGGNVSRAAKSLGTSRRALRDHLKAAGLYPWERGAGELPDNGTAGEPWPPSAA